MKAVRAGSSDAIYREDLAFIHHEGFGEFSLSAAPGIIAILRKQGIDGGTIVDVGCGSGLLARELTASGYRVIGIDPSDAMIAIARRTAPEAAFRIGRFDDADLPPCDAITAVGEVLNYGTMEGVRRFFHVAAEALRPGGVLLFDVAERNAYPEHHESRVGGDDWSVIAIKTRHGDRLLRRILTFRSIGGEIRRDEETHHLELFPRETIVRAARGAGLSVRRRRSYGTRRLPPGHAVYVCRKTPTRRSDPAAALLPGS